MRNVFVLSQYFKSLIGAVMISFAKISNRVFLFMFSLTLFSTTLYAQWVQQGNKLVGTGGVGNGQQGTTVAISADGNTAVVGAPYDATNTGAAWVYVRSAGVWSQQGNKLVGVSPVGQAQQGTGVAISGDGNTIAVAAAYDNTSVGAIWIYIRQGNAWSQQGSKLTTTGGIGQVFLGYGLDLSADGNTLIAGGVGDNTNVGAAWVFTRAAGVWSQQQKLVATGSSGASGLGICSALTPDGNTAVIGGYTDGNGSGAAWVFVRSGGVWTQLGNKLVGTGSTGFPNQGRSVAISSDGGTVSVGGAGDNSGVGAVWVFTRSGNSFTQQGSKLVGTGGVGNANQGWSVSLSGDGNTLVESGPFDGNSLGGFWTFTRNGTTWTQLGGRIRGTGATGNGWQGYFVAMSTDGSTLIAGGNGDNSFAGASWVYASTGATGVEEIQTGDVPKSFALEQNYPNPFNPSTVIKFQVRTLKFVTLKVYDVLGREVRTLVNEEMKAGGYEATFEANGLASGAYFYKLQAGGFVETKRMQLLR
jgi:hypothetical protein